MLFAGERIQMVNCYQSKASSMRKVNGKYYFTYSTMKSHELCFEASGKPNVYVYYPAGYKRIAVEAKGYWDGNMEVSVSPQSTRCIYCSRPIL
jgi:hypothetical protein